MKRIIGSLKYYVGNFLFDNYGIPKVKNERISKVIFKKFLPTDPVIIDCGASDGSDSVELAKQFRKGKIHSFEPVDKLYQRLLQNTRDCDNVTCYPVALADQNGTMDFYVSAGASEGSSSLLEPMEHLKDHPDTFFNKRSSVPTKTLDKWAEENNIKKVDMLWLDMQGFELKMLRASCIILDSVSVIHTEVSTRETYKSVDQYNDYRIFLEEKGFKIYIEAIPAGWDMGNVLFVRK